MDRALKAAILLAAALAARAETPPLPATVESIGDDRPAVGTLVDSRGGIRRWLEIELRGDATGLKYLWDSHDPAGARAAEHEQVDGQGTVVLRVRREMSAPDQLAALVFELFNARGHEVFAAIHRAALAGAIDRGEYATRAVEQELVAWRAARELLAPHFSKAPKGVLAGSPLMRRLLEVEPIMAGVGDESFEHFGRLFDTEVAPTLEDDEIEGQ